jgi:hypothetical protein
LVVRMPRRTLATRSSRVQNQLRNDRSMDLQ